MRDILEYCIGGVRRNCSAGTEVLHEGSRTGHLYVLIEGRLDVIKGDAVVASIVEPGGATASGAPPLTAAPSDTIVDGMAWAKGRVLAHYEGSVSSGAIYTGRCRRCRPAAAAPASTPPSS